VTPATRGILVTTPNNPTGRLLSEQTLTEARHGIILA
jgi:aspartate/methionine/tyrosine aminotransferase